MTASTTAPPRPAPRRARAVPPRRRAIQRVAAALGARAEVAFTLVALFVYSQAVLPLLLEGGSSDVDLLGGHPVLRRVTVAVNGVVVLLCVARWRSWVRAVAAEGWVLALVGLALASTLWSDLPDLTLRRGLVLAGATAFGVYLTARYDPPTLLRLLATVLGVEAVLSTGFALAIPSLGRDHHLHPGAWQGIFTQKNTLGVTMVISTLACLLAWRQATRWRWLPAAGAVLSAALVALSGSATALVIVCTLLALLPLYGLLRARHTLAIPLLIFAVLAAGTATTLLLVNREAVLLALGREPTLTGRTDLWQAAAEAASRKPWVGHGYSAFWAAGAGPSDVLWRRIGWQPPNAHNGYLDVWLDLGLVGLALFGASLLVGAARAVRMVRTTTAAVGLWPLAYLTFMVLYNLTESLVLKQNSIFWVLYVSSVTLVAVHARREAFR